MELSSLKSLIQTPIQLVGEIVHLIKSNTVDYFKTQSLPEVTSLTRVEPITVVSRDLINYEYTHDVMNSLLNLFAAYYLQAVALTARVGSVRVIKILDKLNPNRDSTGFFSSLESLSAHNVMIMDNYKYTLPGISTEGRILDTIAKDERFDFDDLVEQNKGSQNIKHASYGTGPVKLQKEFINESADLAVGKLINVTITHEDVSIDVPVQVRLAAAVLGEHAVSHLMTVKKEDTEFLERFHAWRAGRISFIRDLMFCQDLIDEHRKALMADKAGVYSEIIRRVNNTKKYGLLTQNPSLVSASNLFVISESVAKSVELKIGGKLANPRYRDKIFSNSYAMIIAVIDRDWERVTFYHRGIIASTDLSIKNIRAANKQKGPDVADILTQLAKGNAPTF